MTMKRRALNAVKWTAVEQWGRQILAFAVFALIARILGPSAMGLAAMALIVVVIAEQIVGESLVDAIVQRQDLDDGHIDVAFWLQLVIALALAAVLGLLAAPLAWAFGEPDVEMLVYALLPVVMLIAVASVPSALFRREMQFRILTIRTTLSLLVGGVVGVGLALGGFGVWAIVGQQVTARLVEACTVWAATDWRPSRTGTRRHASDLAHFGMTTLASNIALSVDGWATRFILGVFLGPTALGYYHVAQRLLGTMRKLIISPITRVAFPLFAGIQDDRDRVARTYLRILGLASLIITPCFAGVALVAEPLVVVLFGEAWRPAAPVIQILMLVGMIMAPLSVTGTLFRSLGQPQWMLQVVVINVVVSVVGLTIVTRWGVEAAVLVLLARELVVSVPLLFYRVPRMVPATRRAALTAATTGWLAAGAMAVAVVGVQSWLPETLPDLALLAILSTVGAGVYGGLFLLFHRDGLRELRGLLRRPQAPQSDQTVA